MTAKTRTQKCGFVLCTWQEQKFKDGLAASLTPCVPHSTLVDGTQRR